MFTPSSKHHVYNLVAELLHSHKDLFNQGQNTMSIPRSIGLHNTRKNEAHCKAYKPTKCNLIAWFIKLNDDGLQSCLNTMFTQDCKKENAHIKH